MARLLWEGITTGQATLPSGKVLSLAPPDWLGLVKWVYMHIDGPAPKPIELTGAEGGPLVIEYTGNVDPNDV